MIRQILRQLWNQRRANGWIWAELIVVTYFLWMVIDPVYVLMANHSIDDGFSLEDTYMLKMNEYKSTHRLYQSEMGIDSMCADNYERIAAYVKQYPGVQAVALTAMGSFPQSSYWTGTSYRKDSTEVYAEELSYFPDTDYFGVFRVKQADGKQLFTLTDAQDYRERVVSRSFARKAFPDKENPVGEYILDSDSNAIRIIGVVADLQMKSDHQPSPLVFKTNRLKEVRNFSDDVAICFRVADGMASTAFVEQFKKEMRPRLQVGNFYLESLTPFTTISKQYEFATGTTTNLRLQGGMAFFFLLCTFLGVSGTFWLRCNARREEIGMRMALGGSRREVLKQFLTEAWLLVTAGFLVGVFIALQVIINTDFAYPTRDGSLEYWQNQPITHFLIVSGITYLLLLVTALIGSWIPAARAAQTLPAEALRDE